MTTTENECLLCLIEKEESELMKLKCNHKICLKCMNSYLKEHLNLKIKCPINACQVIIRDSQIRSILSDADIDKYESLSVNLMKKSHKCLLEECTATVMYTDPNVQYQCKVCSLYNCIQCKSAHGFLLCADFQSKTISEKAEISQIEIQCSKQILMKKSLLVLEDIDLLKNDEIFTCKNCFLLIGKGIGVQLQNCGHKFCKVCLIENITKSPKLPVQCPLCDNHVNDREIQSVLSEKQLRSYQERWKNIAKNKLSKYFRCQRPNCNDLYDVSDTLDQFTCRKCKAVNCVKCQTIHKGETCSQFDVTKKEGKYMEAIQEKINQGTLMKCLQCENLLSKLHGCNWIQCSSCGVELCWIRQMLRWGPEGRGDISGGCQCGVNGELCHKDCSSCQPHGDGNDYSGMVDNDDDFSYYHSEYELQIEDLRETNYNDFY